MTPEDKARAVVDAWQQFVIGDEVIITEQCQIHSWAGLRGRITSSYVSNDKLAFGVEMREGNSSLGFWPHELRHAD